MLETLPCRGNELWPKTLGGVFFHPRIVGAVTVGTVRLHVCLSKSYILALSLHLSLSLSLYIYIYYVYVCAYLISFLIVPAAAFMVLVVNLMVLTGNSSGLPLLFTCLKTAPGTTNITTSTTKTTAGTVRN